jgi:hypothetical protein
MLGGEMNKGKRRNREMNEMILNEDKEKEMRKL